jgi:hypothetical protein
VKPASPVSENADGSVAVRLDRRRHGALQLRDPLRGVSVQPPQDHDAGEVGLVAVLEDEVVPGGVVAHVSHAGFCALGLTIQGERRRQRTGLLDRAVVNHVDRHGQLGDQVAGSGTVGERGLEPLVR